MYQKKLLISALKKIVYARSYSSVTAEDVIKVLESIYTGLESSSVSPLQRWAGWFVDTPDDTWLAEEYVPELVKQWKQLYKTWPDPMTIYRCVNLKHGFTIFYGRNQRFVRDDPDKLQLDDIGLSWGHDEEAAQCVYGGDDADYVLRATVKHSDIDWASTIAENITYMDSWDDKTKHVEREVKLRKGISFILEAYKIMGKEEPWVEVNQKATT